jgi:thiol:disulfide interchange protein DsbD
MTRILPLLALALAIAAPPVAAQQDPFAAAANPKAFEEIASVSVEAPPRAKRGELITVKVTVFPKLGAWTYPVNPKDPKQVSRNRFSFELPKSKPPSDFILVGKVTDPDDAKWETKIDGGKEFQASGSPVTWQLKAIVSPQAAPGPKKVEFGPATFIEVCVPNFCLSAPVNDLPTPMLEVTADPPVPVPPEYEAAVNAALNRPVAAVAPATAPRSSADGGKPAAAGPKTAKPTEEYQAELDEIARGVVDKRDDSGAAGDKKSGLGAFLLTAALWGLISLVTPCVFPMIPITVSIFLKQAHGSLRERLKLAAVYCLTIVTVLGASAFALLKFMAWLSAHPVTNLLLGALFMVMALSLFGMYELTLPNFMVRRLQAKQAKGGAAGTVFGALAFTVISFTCVAPFLGGFAGISAADSASTSLIVVPTTREVLGGLAFASAFAAPFFVLALVPGLLKALPKSGGWLDSVKVVMAFLELAAALKFFRTAELRVLSPTEYFTYDLVMGGWIAICAACGLYLLNMYRLPHDEERPSIGVPRLLFALLFLGLGMYLLPAMFKGPNDKNQRPAGAVYAWIEAFLLPESENWPTDLKDATNRSKTGGYKPVFVDFTGVTCTNCKYNEHNVFPMPAVRVELEKFERVQLYTDEVPESAYASDPGHLERVLEARANDKFKFDVFRDQRLPLYAVFVPRVSDGKLELLGVYPEGKINDPAAFVKFLKDMQEKAAKK